MFKLRRLYSDIIFILLLSCLPSLTYFFIDRYLEISKINKKIKEQLLEQDKVIEYLRKDLIKIVYFLEADRDNSKLSLLTDLISNYKVEKNLQSSYQTNNNSNITANKILEFRLVNNQLVIRHLFVNNGFTKANQVYIDLKRLSHKFEKDSPSYIKFAIKISNEQFFLGQSSNPQLLFLKEKKVFGIPSLSVLRGIDSIYYYQNIKDINHNTLFKATLLFISLIFVSLGLRSYIYYYALAVVKEKERNRKLELNRTKTNEDVYREQLLLIRSYVKEYKEYNKQNYELINTRSKVIQNIIKNMTVGIEISDKLNYVLNNIKLFLNELTSDQIREGQPSQLELDNIINHSFKFIEYELKRKRISYSIKVGNLQAESDIHEVILKKLIISFLSALAKASLKDNTINFEIFEKQNLLEVKVYLALSIDEEQMHFNEEFDPITLDFKKLKEIVQLLGGSCSFLDSNHLSLKLPLLIDNNVNQECKVYNLSDYR